MVWLGGVLVRVRASADRIVGFVEGFLRERSVKYRVERFYGAYGLRMVIFRVGLFGLKRIVVHVYLDGTCDVEVPDGFKDLAMKLSIVFPKYVERGSRVTVLDRYYDALFEYQRYRKLVRESFTAFVIGCVASAVCSLFLGLYALLILAVFAVVPFGYWWRYGGDEIVLGVLFPYYWLRMKRARVEVEKWEPLVKT